MCQSIQAANTDDGSTKITTAQKNTVNTGNDVKGHPVTLDEFYMQYPSFIWGPILVAGLLYGVTNHVDAVVEFLKSREMEAFGWNAAWQYTLFGIVSSYAFHGFCATHAPQNLKIQADKEYQVKPDAMAIRSTAALITELVYTFLPLAPNSGSWWQFAAWTAILAVYWDFQFYVCHRFAHENKAAYRFFHKTHHLCKAPNCFGAYFVTYQSHIALEQSVVLIMAMCGLPRDVFMFYMYWGTIGTFVEHCGYEMGHMKLPLLPITFGQLSKVLGISTSLFLDGVSVAEHDWHHEKFFDNYSLSFKYLDKMFGTYHPGREPGTSKILKAE